MNKLSFNKKLEELETGNDSKKCLTELVEAGVATYTERCLLDGRVATFAEFYNGKSLTDEQMTERRRILKKYKKGIVPAIFNDLYLYN